MRDESRAKGDVSLSEVVAGHGPISSPKSFFNSGGNGRIPDHGNVHELCDCFPGNIILRGPEAAAGYHCVAALEGQTKSVNDAPLIVAYPCLKMGIDSCERKLFPDPGRVGIDVLAEQQLGSDCNDLAAHEVAPLTPLGLYTRMLASSALYWRADAVWIMLSPMCGRYARHSSVHEFAELFGAQGELELAPSFNVAPTQDVLAVREEPAVGRRLRLLRWGLVPFWSKGPDNRYSMINARADTLDQKPAYRAAFRSRRCLIAANGFYEWQRSVGGKQPVFVSLADGAPFAMAGLWERWKGADERIIESCAIVTTDANECLTAIHDRMPVILRREDYETWLDPGIDDAGVLKQLLCPYPEGALLAYPVSRHVNSVANDDAECMQPLGEL